jgi:glyoxylase-like metal-dependent hydrolase (beta-lactamase superfamily II)
VKLALLISLALVAVLVLTACVGLRTPPFSAFPEVPRRVTQRFGAITIHAVHTGWVRVKTKHRDLSGPVSSRMLGIVADPSWTPWMPVTSYVIDHPEGVFVVDTGLSEGMLDEAYFACDPGTAFVYGNLLQFSLAPEDRIDRRLAELGLEPGAVKGIVLTHRHGDHTGGLEFLPASATIYVGEGDWPMHAGALACRWPAGRTPTLVGRDGEPVEAMIGSRALTTDGAVRVVPLNGHSPGHLGVLVQLGGRSALLAGDALFDLDQLRERRLAGIVELPDLARASLDLVARQLETVPTFLLLAHDPDSLARFAKGEVARL